MVRNWTPSIVPGGARKNRLFDYGRFGRFNFHSGTFFRHCDFGFIMPRYFFHVYHDRAELDFAGEELPDKHAAWHEATVMAGQTLQSLDGKLTPDKEWRMEVTDEFANPLYVLHINGKAKVGGADGAKDHTFGGPSNAW
jgi:hypothetical protein